MLLPWPDHGIGHSLGRQRLCMSGKGHAFLAVGELDCEGIFVLRLLFGNGGFEYEAAAVVGELVQETRSSAASAWARGAT